MLTSDDLYTEIKKALKRKLDPGDVQERAAEIVFDEGALDITNINEAQRNSLRVLLRRAINEGWTQEKLADAIIRRVGLTDRDALAVDNYEQKLKSEGYTPARIRQLSAQYGKRLLSRRGQTIAHYEVVEAYARAQRELWEEAKEDRQMAWNATRRWVTHKDERTCIVCAPMHGKRARVGEPYPNGLIGPPAHPNCRCHEVLNSEA